MTQSGDTLARPLGTEGNPYAIPMSVLSFLRPGGAALQRIVYAAGRRSQAEHVRGLGVIHFARLGIIAALPGGGDPIPHPLQLFESNYNGSFGAYIDTFVQALRHAMYEFWWSSYGFPRGLPPSQFKRYIQANLHEVGHYYVANPDASVRIIASALRVQQLDAQLRRETAKCDDTTFQQRLDALVPVVQRPPKMTTLTGAASRRDAVANRPDPNRNGCSYAVTVLTRIIAGQTETVRDVLAGFAGGSPLATCSDVHFGRWVIISRLPVPPVPPSPLSHDYLLFTADLTAPPDHAEDLPESFFQELSKGAGQEVWRCCDGYSPEVGLVPYLTAHQLTMGMYFAAFPDLTPAEVRRALDIRRGLTKLLADGGRGSGDLRTAYLKASQSW